MKKVLLIFGTRPEAIKMLPVYLELKKRNFIKPIICLTGQHKELIDPVMKIFGVKEDYNKPVDGDTRLLPKGSIELAGLMKPMIDTFKADIQALAYLILPPSLPSGAPNPSFMKGMKIKFDNIHDYFNISMGSLVFDLEDRPIERLTDD